MSQINSNIESFDWNYFYFIVIANESNIWVNLFANSITHTFHL
jgi:hypothetical protein